MSDEGHGTALAYAHHFCDFVECALDPRGAASVIRAQLIEVERLRAGLAVRDEALAAIAALHRTWYEINGKRIDLHVYVSEPPEGHVCLKPGDSQYSDVCDAESDEHYVLACTECRASTDEGEPGYRPWPCDTQRISANLQRSLDPYRDDKEQRPAVPQDKGSNDE